MRPESILQMIAECYVKKDACEEDNDDDAYGCSGEELKVEMLLAEKPLSETVKGGKTGAFCWSTGGGRYFSTRHN